MSEARELFEMAEKAWSKLDAESMKMDKPSWMEGFIKAMYLARDAVNYAGGLKRPQSSEWLVVPQGLLEGPEKSTQDG